jgi:hypothetical protein
MNIIVVVVQTARCGGGEQEEYRGEERTGRFYTLDSQCPRKNARKAEDYYSTVGLSVRWKP